MSAHNYWLHLADNALVLGQRNAEWCGHGPILEEDIAMTNNSLDLIGQARMLYQGAAEAIGGGATEDSLAYFRDSQAFKNLTLVELPHHGPLVGYATDNRDYAVTIVRNFLYSALMALVWERLANVANQGLAAIAAKSLKETRYHLRHSHDWLVRFGDGTIESAQRAQAALDYLVPFTQEFWLLTPYEAAAIAAGDAVDVRLLKDDWTQLVSQAVDTAKLQMPVATVYVTQGKFGTHSEHLSYLLAEMQSLARAHPEGVW